MHYRADIDGLRAVAVLSVVSFHLKFGASGGFVGVDVFFVISGYLISKIIFSEVRDGTFSIVKFYERRARRILPALTATILVSYLVGLRALYPNELVAFSKSALAAILFVANIHFFTISDYFAPTANTVPLLHLWSLGIEEQFYILLPLLAIFLARYSIRVLFASLLVMAVGSVLASGLALKINPTAAFYLLQYRAFELLIGCLIALTTSKLSPHKLLAETAAAAGAISLTLAILLFGPQTPFPGAAALLPCGGAALIIWSGQFVQTTVSRLLGSSPVVYVGKISYSLYLVHWPAIVLGSRFFPDASPIAFEIGVICGSLILAALSYHFIEQPFRQKRSTTGSLRVLSAAALSICAVACLSGVTIFERGFARPSEKQVQDVLAYLSYDYRKVYRSRECFLDPDQDFTEADVSKCLPEGPGTLAMLWGDSHAIDLYPGLQVSMAKNGYSLGVLTASACAPIIGYSIAGRPKCPSFNDHALPTILSVGPKVVILSASWILSDQTMDQLDATVERLTLQGMKVIILGQSPGFKEPVPRTIANRLLSGNPNMWITEAGLDLSRAQSDEIISSRFRGRANVKFISMMQLICPQLQCALVTDDGTPTYWDSEHFTEKGSQMIADKLASAILR